MRAQTAVGWFLAVISINAIAQQPPQHPIILNDGTAGAVQFDHTAHLKVAAKCVVCHHPSKALKPLKAPQQACTDCHTRPSTPPVTTGLPAAFHNATATAGLCVDCHQEQNAGGKAAPVQCTDCHHSANE